MAGSSSDASTAAEMRAMQRAEMTANYFNWKKRNKTTVTKEGESTRKMVKRGAQAVECHGCGNVIAPGERHSWQSQYRFATHGQGSARQNVALWFHPQCCPANDPLTDELALRFFCDDPMRAPSQPASSNHPTSSAANGADTQEEEENEEATGASAERRRCSLKRAHSLLGEDDACHERGEYERAAELHREALQVLLEKGDAHLELGEYERAAELNREALQALLEEGDAHLELGEYGWAADIFSSALKVRQNIARLEERTDHYEEAIIHSRCGMSYAKLGHLENARASLQEATDELDFVRNTLSGDEALLSFADDPLPTYVARLFLEVLAELNQPEQAFQCAERFRSHALEMHLAQERTRELEFQAIIATTKRKRGEPVPTPFIPRPEASEDVAKLRSLAVRRRSAIVVFCEGMVRRRLFVWIVKSHAEAGLAFKELSIPPDDTSLTQVVELTRRTLNVRARHTPRTRDGDRASSSKRDLVKLDEDLLEREWPPKDPQTTMLRRCYDLLIQPLVELLEGETSLIIVPDRDLYALPFGALRDADGKHLIEKYRLCMSPSSGALIELELRTGTRPSTNIQDALVVGDPDFQGRAAQLPGALKEAGEVSQRLRDSGIRVKSLTGPDATKDAVIDAMCKSELVHLATHGEPDGVYLSGQTETDGKLTMNEVHRRLKLNRARLVVLSECDSFRGELHPDGVIGITRAFLAAGAATLMATLWKVEDDPTLVLIQHFYDRLLVHPNRDAAAALQSAMISMIREGYTVRQWASFVCYGLPSLV